MMSDFSSLSPNNMTSSVTTNKFSADKIVWPAHTLISHYVLKQAVIEFLDNNPEGVRNCDVGRALGYNDTRQWFSHGLLTSLVEEKKVEKRTIMNQTLYFSVG